MTNHVTRWMKEDSDDLAAIEDAYAQLTWLQHELFDEYEPHPYVKFADRVDGWLDNFPNDADRRAMYRLLPYIFFVGREQMASLSRTAYSDVATRWVIDQAGISLADPNLAEALASAMARTWFCPVTDSMKINSFLKLNDLGGHGIRPDWLSLAEIGDGEKIAQYVGDQKIERLVLLEDFVGSGMQMQDALMFARRTLPHLPTLVIPLVCCPVGRERGLSIAREDPLLTFEAVLSLKEDLFVSAEPRIGEPEEFADARRLSDLLKEKFGRDFMYPLGWHLTGALVVLHTNTPDNTLPLIHDEGDGWKAIFPRISRN